MSKMSNKRRLAVLATATCLMDALFSSSSSSEDEMEDLFIKAYFKYKAKRRKLCTSNFSCSSSSSSSDSGSEDENNFSRAATLDSVASVTSLSAGRTQKSPTPEFINVSDTEPSNMLDTQNSDRESDNVIDLIEFIPEDESDADNQSSLVAETSVEAEVVEVSVTDKKSSVNSIIATRIAKLENFVPFEMRSGWTTSADFKNAFKISRSAAEKLLGQIILKTNWKYGRPTIASETGLLVTLWILATRESFSQVCLRFGGIGKSTTHRTFIVTCQAIADLDEYKIKWPVGPDAEKVVQDFQFSIPGISEAFPGTFGCLGATHIRIAEHKDKYSGYYNRFNFPSIVVQAVCDSSGRFIDVSPGHVGSCSDSNVWCNSSLYQRLKSEPELLPEDTHLIGHEAYPLATNLMVPYWPEDGCLTPEQIQFNFTLNNRRSLIETVFSKLKQQWPRLQLVDNRKLDERCKDIIMAACICYNIALDDGEIVLDDDVMFDDTGYVVGQYQDEVDEEFNIEEEAIIKRDNICLLCQVQNN